MITLFVHHLTMFLRRGARSTCKGQDLSTTSLHLLHSRGNNISQDNLIAIEMKKSSRPEDEKNKDRDRLKALTKDSYNDIWSFDGETLPEHVCRYELGVFYEVNYSKRRILIEYYRQGEIRDTKTISY